MKSVIKSQHVQQGAEAHAIHGSSNHAEVSLPGARKSGAPTPGVRLVRLDGRVSAIEVTCRCGEVSVLELEYENEVSKMEPSQ